MLFGCDGFWLYEQAKNVPIQRITAKYSDAGSFELIQRFFAPILEKFEYMDRICDELQVIYADPMWFDDDDGTVSAFLGQGGFGRVVKTVREYDDKYNFQALKIVDIEHIAIVDKELSLLLTHSDSCKCGDIVTPLSTVLVKNKFFCGYVMEPAGISTCSKQLIRKKDIIILDILKALRQLHAHNPIIIHGDPRLQNLLCLPSENNHKQKLCWVDLMQSVFDIRNPSENIKKDMTTLVKSIIGEDQCSASAISNSVIAYSEDISMETLNILADAVTLCFFGTI
eukprot:gene16541-22582_t